MKNSSIIHGVWLLAAVAAFGVGRITVNSKADADSAAVSGKKATSSKGTVGAAAGGGRQGATNGGANGLKRGSSAAGVVNGSRITVAGYLSETDSLKANKMFADLLLELDADNAREVFDALRESRRDGMQFGQQMGLFLEAWGKLDGAAAIAASTELGNDPRRSGFASMAAMTGWASVDPAAAKAHLEAMESGENGWQKGMLAQGLISGLAKNDPGAATDYVFQLDAERKAAAENGEGGGQDDRWRGYAVDRQMDAIASVQMSRGITEATAWAEGLPEGELKASALDRVAEDYARQDPAAAAQWISSHSGEEWAGRAVREVAEEYARADAPKAAEWAEGLAAESQSGALRETFETWTREDPVAAGNYLANMNPGDGRDAAVSSFARELDRQEPQTAASWAGTIANEDLRNETLVSVAQSWMRSNNEEAQAWLPTSGLTVEAQEKIINDAQRGGDRRGGDRRGR